MVLKWILVTSKNVGRIGNNSDGKRVLHCREINAGLFFLCVKPNYAPIVSVAIPPERTRAVA